MTEGIEVSKRKIPFMVGSKSFLVAQRLLAGEKDDDEICREVIVKKRTLWNVKSELRKLGYIKKRTHPPPATSPAPQATTSGSPSRRSPGETHSPTTQLGEVPGEVAGLPRDLAGEVAGRVATWSDANLGHDFSSTSEGGG